MKQETSKKSKKWIWLVAGAVLLLAIVGVVLAMVLGGGNKDASGGRADLYWNVDRLSFLEGGSGLSNREPAEDGLYHVKFAYNGEHVEYTVSDKRLINFIDSQEVMGLKFDDSGMVIDAVAVTDLATEVGHPLYVQGVEGSTIKANTSPSMNALSMDIAVTEQTQIYDVTNKAELVGAVCDISAVLEMDRLYVYANDAEEITHIYIVKHAVKSPVYWRIDQFYSSSKKETTREPDENGVYTIDFFCDGERVTLQCKKKDVVNAIDSRSVYSAHMGLEFDAEGYIINTVGSGEGIGGLLMCERYWITSFNGNVYTAEKPGTSDPVHNFAIPSTAKIYDVGKAAMVEGRQGKQVDYVNEGDRVCVWTDTNGAVVLVYVSNSVVDVPVFFSPDRQYDSKTAGTAREPDYQGYYCFELYEDGATGLKTYKTKDKAIADYLDSIPSHIVGLVIKDDNIIERVYDPESVFANTHYTYGRFVNDITGPIVSCILIGQPLNANTAVLSPTCEIYNVSGYGEYGLTTLQPGDRIYAMRDPTGEVVRIYILRRYIGEDSLYYILDSQYDAENKTTKRQPDEDGWYRILTAHNGKQVTLRTRSKAMVEKVETIDSVGAACLIVSGDVIVQAFTPQESTGGSKISSGYRVKSFNDDGTITTFYKTRESTFRLAEDCVFYNVSTHTASHKGEAIYNLQYGDMLTVFTDWRGEAKVVYVRMRVADKMGWKTEALYDGTNKVTKREPDAEGWYYVDIACDGEVKTYKTKNKELMSNIDSYGAAFGFSANGDVLTGFSATNWTRGVGGNGVTNYDVVAIDGNKVTVKYNVPGSADTGKTKTIYLASNAKIYDVSPTAEKFGMKTELKVGDRIRTYISDSNKESHVYAYILYHDTRVAGQEAYCEHCNQIVYWNPWAGESLAKSERHYYLNTDVEAKAQTSVGLDGKDYEVVIDLNGKTINYNHTSATLVRYNEVLTIMDSVGSGKMTSTGNDGALTGMFMVNNATVNVYGGTIGRSESDARISHGGLFRLSGGTLNVYGGEITGGAVEPVDKDGAAFGGNIYAQSKSVINVYGGKISAGVANSFEYLKWNEKEKKEEKKSVDGLGGNIYLTSKSQLNVYGGELVGGNAVHGGNVYVAGGVANFYGGVVADGVATNGGNVYIGGGAKATVQDNALITRGVSTRLVSRNNGGGNFFLQKNADLIMLGGSITDGTAVSYGGNIACRAGRFTIEGGVVSGGKSESGIGNNVFINGNTGKDPAKPESDAMMVAKGGKIFDGDVYLYEPDSDPEMRLGLSGTPVIEHLRMDAGALAELYELTKGADINVNASGVFTKPYAKAESYVKAGYIKRHENAEGDIKVKDDALSLIYEKFCAHCNQDVIWTKWKHQNGGSATAINEDGHYYVAEDILGITAQLRIGVAAVADDPNTPDVDETVEAAVVDAVLDLNGHSMQSEKRVFAVYPGSTLSIVDSVGGGEIRGAMVDAKQHGGVIRVDAGSTLNLYSGTITDIATEAHAGNGGAISTEGGTINILGGTVNGGTAKFGGTIYVSKAANASGGAAGNLNISGGVINGGVAACEDEAPYGGAIAVVNGNLKMTGGKVTGGQAKSETKSPAAGNIYLSGNNTYKFEITGGIIENGTAVNGNGGNIYLANGELTIAGDAKIVGGIAERGSSRNNGGGNIYGQVSVVLNINGGEIVNGTATQSYGGNILMRGTLNMTDGVIAGGTATNGGNIFVNGYDRERIFTMTGGTIKDGTATTGAIDRTAMVKPAYDGDNIYVNSAIIDISGGTITDNDGGNAILAYTSKTTFPAIVQLTVAENEELAANLDSLVYLIKGADLYADLGGTKADADGDKVWVLEGYDDVVTTEPTTVPTEPTTVPTEPSEPTEPSAPSEPPEADLTGECPHCGKKIADLTWIEWTAKSGGSVSESGHYYLTGDVKGIVSQLKIGASDGSVTSDVVVDLRGYTMESSKRVFAVYPGSSLSIMDTAGSGAIKGAMIDAKQNGGVIRVDHGSTLNLYSGTITDVATEAHLANGGAISTEGGTINIAGGVVNGGTAKFGGTIYVSKAANAQGGAAGNLNISGGIINGGVAACETEAPYGGAIAVVNGNLKMTGGKVTGGSVTSTAKTPVGGNIYLSGNNTYKFEITGGIIENGTAVNGNGGNIYIANGTLTVGGDAKIVGGVAERAISRNNGGGNIYGQTSTTLNINGGEITNGTSTNSYGGNIFVRGTLNITDGVISGGTAINGGNVFMSGYDGIRVFTMTGGTIKDGTATTGKIDRTANGEGYDGDNIYVNSAIMNISGGMITDNDGGNAILAYTPKADYPATINLQLADNTDLAEALDGKIYLISTATVLNADIGDTSDVTEGEKIWNKVAPETEPTEPSVAPTEPSVAPTEPSVAPTEPSVAPTEPSVAPTEPSTAPSEPTDATEPSEPSVVTCPHCENANWQEKTFTSGERVTASGHYYLTGDVTGLYSQIRIGEDTADGIVDVVIDLRGHDIISSSRAFYIGVGSKLTIIDTVGDGEVIGAYADSGAGGTIYVSAGTADATSEFNLYGGTISSKDKTAKGKNGGTIYVSKYAKFNMYGGVLNSAPADGGANGSCLYITASETEVNLCGGIINGSTLAGNRGGVIYMTGNKDTTVLNISGDIVINGGNASRGGFIFVNVGTVNISGGTIQGGKASSTGGAICLYTANAVLNVTGGTINSANADAIGTIWATAGAAVNISGGNIGGQVVMDGTAVATLSGMPTIENLNLTTSTVLLNLGQGGVTGGSIGVTGVAGAISNASDDATASAKFFTSTDESLQPAAVDGQIHLVAATRSIRSLAKAVIAGGLKDKMLTR